MITITKRVQWVVTAAAILLLIMLWIAKGQEDRRPLNPVQPGKTAPMPDDNRGHRRIDRDKRSAYATTPENPAPWSVDILRQAAHQTGAIPSGKTIKIWMAVPPSRIVAA